VSVCHQNATDEETCEDQGRADRTQIKAAFLMRFGKEIAQRRTKRTSQDKRQPKQERARNVRHQVSGYDNRQQTSNHKRPTFVSETRTIGQEIAKGGSERV
jgi:hypothetical protein